MTTIVDVDPYAGDPLALRLRGLEIPTPDAVLYAAEGHAVGHPSRFTGRAVRRLAWRGGLTAALVALIPALLLGVFRFGASAPVTVHVPGYTIELAAARGTAPRLSRDQAVATALGWLAIHPVESGPPPRGLPGQITGFAVSGVTYESQVLKVWHQCGAHWFLNAAENLWVVDLRAPAQLGWTYVQASVLVNDNSGAVRYTDALLGKANPTGC